MNIYHGSKVAIMSGSRRADFEGYMGGLITAFEKIAIKRCLKFAAPSAVRTAELSINKYAGTN